MTIVSQNIHYLRYSQGLCHLQNCAIHTHSSFDCFAYEFEAELQKTVTCDKSRDQSYIFFVKIEKWVSFFSRQIDASLACLCIMIVFHQVFIWPFYHLLMVSTTCLIVTPPQGSGPQSNFKAFPLAVVSVPNF